MNRVQEYKEFFESSLHDKSKPWTKYLEQVEGVTGVNRLYIGGGLAVFIALYLVYGFGAGLLCNLIGFGYPAYISIRAIESPQKDDDTKWLTYWVVYAVFSLVEYFSDTLVGWFPFYWLVKCVFQIWCFVPSEINGSLVIYRSIIRPYYLKHHSRIDDLADSASKLVGETIKKAKAN